MLKRVHGYLLPREGEVPEGSVALQTQGYAVLRDVLSADEVTALSDEIAGVYENYPRDNRQAAVRDPEEDEDFRYEMFNRSALAQQAIAHPDILEVIEPLIGEDCHVIANTCWRNPPREAHTHGGGFWHIDAGPHIPRDPNVAWDARIPYPVFVVGVHIYLQDCPMQCGPTGVIPGSHTSGQPPPHDRYDDVDLTWNGQGVVPVICAAGDVGMFVSDIWHRRLPTQTGDYGRLFLQAHYGRRDIAQRLRPTAVSNQVSAEAEARIDNERMRTLLGLHRPMFYDG